MHFMVVEILRSYISHSTYIYSELFIGNHLINQFPANRTRGNIASDPTKMDQINQSNFGALHFFTLVEIRGTPQFHIVLCDGRVQTSSVPYFKVVFVRESSLVRECNKIPCNKKGNQ